jgi:hypothetical protein
MNNPYDNRTFMNKASKCLINDLIAQAESYTQSFPMYAPEYRKTFKAGTMSASCIDSKEAVQGLITRLKKGLTAKAGTFQSKKSGTISASIPFKSIIKEFLQDDEIDNAINYALLKNKLDQLKLIDVLTNEQRLYINEYCYKLAA